MRLWARWWYGDDAMLLKLDVDKLPQQSVVASANTDSNQVIARLLKCGRLSGDAAISQRAGDWRCGECAVVAGAGAVVVTDDEMSSR